MAVTLKIIIGIQTFEVYCISTLRKKAAAACHLQGTSLYLIYLLKGAF